MLDWTHDRDRSFICFRFKSWEVHIYLDVVSSFRWHALWIIDRFSSVLIIWKFLRSESFARSLIWLNWQSTTERISSLWLHLGCFNLLRSLSTKVCSFLVLWEDWKFRFVSSDSFSRLLVKQLFIFHVIITSRAQLITFFLLWLRIWWTTVQAF